MLQLPLRLRLRLRLHLALPSRLHGATAAPRSCSACLPSDHLRPVFTVHSYAEPTITYNSAIVGALAGLAEYYDVEPWTG